MFLKSLILIGFMARKEARDLEKREGRAGGQDLERTQEHALFRATSRDTVILLLNRGPFEVGERAAGTGRDPRTGEEMKIAASRVAGFKPGAALKAAVNGSGWRSRGVA